MTDLENREAFENYIMGLDIFKRRSPKFLFLLDDYGAYDHQEILALYDAWNASAQRQGFKLVPLEPSEEMYSDLSRHLCRYMQMKDRYCPKTLGDYIKRYIGFKNIPQWLHDEVWDWESTHAFATADLGVFIYKAMIDAV